MVFSGWAASVSAPLCFRGKWPFSSTGNNSIFRQKRFKGLEFVAVGF